MADTRRSLTALAALFADNVTGDISPQDLRDFLASASPPYASIYLSTSAETSIAGANTWTKLAGTTTSRALSDFTMPTDNRITYTGTPTIHVHVAVTIAMTSVGNNQTIAIRVVKNADETDADSVASQTRRFVGTGADVGSTALHFDAMMDTNDYIEIWAENQTSGGNIEITDMYFFALGMLR